MRRTANAVCASLRGAYRPTTPRCRAAFRCVVSSICAIVRFPSKRVVFARGGRRGPYEGQNVVRSPAITLRPPCGAKPRTTDVA